MSSSMPYRMLGNTGLQVSVLSYGFWATFGVKDGLKDDEGIQRAKECLTVARKGGVNLFDNAEVYGSPRGAAETVMGEAIAQLAKPSIPMPVRLGSEIHRDHQDLLGWARA